MVYTRRSVWPLVLGILMVAYAYMVQSGAMEPVIKFLGSGRNAGEMQILGYTFGAIGIVAGLLQLLTTPKEGQGDYLLSMVGGVIFIMAVAFIVKWGLDPLMAQWGRAAQPTLGFNFASVMNLNYVVMGILAGIIIVNVFKVPG